MIKKFNIFEKIYYKTKNEHILTIYNKYLQKIAEFFGYYNEDIYFIDSGVYGNAYRVSNKVLKITSDESEYLSALSLIKKNTKYIVNYYDARIIDDTKNYIHHNEEVDIEFYYALVMDILEPLTNTEAYLFSDIMFSFDFKHYYDANSIDELLDEIQNHHDYSPQKKKIAKRIVNDLVNIHKESEKLNIQLDDMHVGNVAIKKEDNKRILVAIDLGTRDIELINKARELKPIDIKL